MESHFWRIAGYTVVVAGIALAVWARQFRTADAPRLADNDFSGIWTPVWGQKSWFTRSGFALRLGGTVMIAAGLLGLALSY